jgi:hypothetical protein
MNRPLDSPAEGSVAPTRVPEADRPSSRSEEQEVAAGRTASTPFAALGSVAFVIAGLVVVALVLVVLAFYLA